MPRPTSTRKPSPPAPTPPTLDPLLASREMILVAGSGGVGKTTVAAALGVAAVQRQHGRVLVLTVDPARRLATALGIEAFGNTPHPIPP
ncbi:ArsA-related P-loop ATPase, partial [Ilumatobacter sp.]|uniref:ArsA-related P-loop ATPase n=1 Tax=Ilumatobacter sp. TaxID=1967498 RepID=UPI003C519435